MGAPVIGLHIAFNGGFKAVERVFTRASIVTVAASRLASVWRSWRDRLSVCEDGLEALEGKRDAFRVDDH
jgi:hypothetical protein